MIEEYAIDPDLILKWAMNIRDYSEFIQSFGIGTPRIATTIPRSANWKSIILRSLDESLPEDVKARATELVEAIGETTVNRSQHEYNGNIDWLNNVKNSHQKVAIDHIFIKEPSSENSIPWFVQDMIYTGKAKFWYKNAQTTIPRTSAAYAGLLHKLLSLSNKIVFVDPYVRTTKSKIDPLIAMLVSSLKNRVSLPAPEATIIFSASAIGAPETSYVYQKLTEKLSRFANKPIVKVLSYDEKPGGEKLHNRYVLTELGGVSFGTGLDESESNHSDDVFLLSKSIYELRWNQYVNADAFKVVGAAPRK